jgi:hypothetical protein
MKKILIFTLLIILFSCSAGEPVARGGEPAPAAAELYGELGLEGRISPEAFERAVDGYNRARDRQRNVLTLIDFTKPSTERRLWVIDMTSRRVLFHTWVAHGQGSGENYATRFSNRRGSHQSSLGLYLTGTTYNGGNGYSLLLEGLDPGVNDNARSRAVVVHGAAYADPSVIPSAGRLGRSWGCPALPPDVTRPIIDSIKNGSVLYIWGIQSDSR